MNKLIMKRILVAAFLCCFISCKETSKKRTNESSTERTINKQLFNLEKTIADCEAQLEISVPKLTDLTVHPRLIETGETEWKEVPNGRLMWTSGFYPGILWYMYDLTKDEKWKLEAIKRTNVMEEFKTVDKHHDIDFMMYPPFGLG